MSSQHEWLVQGFQHHQAGRLQDAERHYREVLATDPGCAQAWHFLGLLKCGIGDRELGAQFIARSLEIDSYCAEAHANLGVVLKDLGRIQEATACYRRAIELQPTYATAHYYLGLALIRQNQIEQAVASFRRAIELKPNYAEASRDLGIALQRQGQTHEAVDCFRRAIEVRPTYAEAYNNLANALQNLHQIDNAIAAYRQALRLKPELAEAYTNLGALLVEQGKPDEAIALHRRAIELQPLLAAAHSNLGGCLTKLLQLDEAEASYRRALAIKPDFPEALAGLGTVLHCQLKLDAAVECYSRAIALRPEFAIAHLGRAHLRLLTGDFENGLQEYEWRWKTGQLWRRDFVQPEWKGEALEGRTLLIHAEQGLGDTIQFIRYAELVKASGGRVLVECHPALRELLKSYECADGLIATGNELPHFDVQLPLLSVPRVLKTNASRIPCRVPYLAANPRLVAAWREKLASRDAFRIAINWHGRAGQEMFRLRNVPLDHFAALGQLPGVQLISIQKGEGRRELSEADNCEAIWDFHEEIDTVHGPFMDTAAIMMNVDLVITSDTAVPHLAGALGVPVWVALPFVPDWRWLLGRSDSPWYPTMRLFRQTTPGDWAGVFAEIRKALTAETRLKNA